jgi:hypothetical protein
MTHVHEDPFDRPPRRPPDVGLAPAWPPAVEAILALQRGAGNAAVSRHIARLQVARAPQPQAPPKRFETNVELVDTEVAYSNFLGAMSRVIDNKGGAPGTWELMDSHQELIASMRRVLQYGYDRNTWGPALQLWESVSHRFDEELSAAREAGVRPAQVKIAADQLKYVTKTVEGGAYHEAHREALSDSTLVQPDLVHAQAKLKVAEKKYLEAEFFGEKVKPLVGDAVGMAGGAKSGTGKAVWDLVALPGTIDTKLAWAKKQGIVGQTATAIDLVNVIGDSADNVVKLYAAAFVPHLRTARNLALSQRLAGEAARYEKVLGAWEKRLKLFEKIGKGANVAAIIAEGIKLADALQKSPVDWNAIVDSGLEIGLNAAELALGADGAPILAIVMVIKIEIAILGMVSDQIKWAKRETARGAAADFIGVAATIAKHQASGFVADCELAVSAKQPRVAELATAKVLREAPKVAKSLQVLSSHIARHSKDSIGGYPDMVSALGRDAMRVFNNPAPPEDPLNVAEQLQAVFAGANSLARHVQGAYKE